jgi:hypothetical protein
MLRLLLAASILAAAAHPAQIVEGHVVNSTTGADLRGVAVKLLPVGEGQDTYSGATDFQGHFRIEGVRDGAYNARYMAPGFWSTPNIMSGRSQPLQIAATGDPVRLEVRMQPIPRISGRVTDATGKPVANATVWFLWQSPGCKVPACFPFSHQSKTDAKGEYTMGDPDVPGTWLLSASAPASWNPPEQHDSEPLGWAQTFYSGVTDPRLAAPVIIQPGSELGNLDIKLAAVPVHRLRGTLLDVWGHPVPKASVELSRGFGPTLGQDTKDDGAFEFAAVGDGEWSLSTIVDRDGVKLRGAQSRRIEGRDLDHIELRLTAPLSIHGTVVMEVPTGAVAAEPPRVMLAFDAGDSQAPEIPRIFLGEPDDSGAFVIHDAYPGTYQILPGPPPPGYYLDSIRLGSSDAVASDVRILSDVQPVSVIYKLGGGTVRGTVEGCNSARVLLVPQDPGLRRGLFVRTVTCARDGRFEFSAVRPGEYYGFGMGEENSTPWYAAMLDTGLMNQAAKVTVRANESTAADIRMLAR